MAFVGMGSFRHYQPPIAGLYPDGQSTTSNLRLPTAHAIGNDLTSHGESKKPSGSLVDYDLIEFIDITGPLPEEPLNPFDTPAPDLDYTERDAEDTSNGLDTTYSHDRSGGEKDGHFPSVEELLLGAGKAQAQQRTSSSDGQATGGSAGNSEPTAEGDRNSAASPRSSEGEHQEELVVVGDTRSGDRTQDAQREAGGGDQEREAVRLGDPSTVAYITDSEDDSDAYKAVRNQPPPQFKYPSILRPQDRKNRASSTRNKPGSPGNPIVVDDDDTDSDGTSEEQVGDHISLGTSPTSGGGSEARYFNLHEKGERDTPNTSPPYRNTLSSTPGKQTYGSNGGNCKGLRPDPSTGRDKKNPWNGQKTEADNKKEDQESHNIDGDKETTPSLGPIEKKRPSASNDRVKRRRCLSPERDEANSSQDNITAQAEEWEIVKILGKRETVSGREYLVRWTSTWLPEGQLGNARELLREFKAKGRAPHGRKRVRPARRDKVW